MNTAILPSGTAGSPTGATSVAVPTGPATEWSLPIDGMSSGDMLDKISAQRELERRMTR